MSIVLHHTIGINAEPCSSLGLRFEAGPDVHAGRIKPAEAWLLLTVYTIDEADYRLQDFLVDCLLALLGEWPCILAFLLAPRSITGIAARGVRCSGKTFQGPAPP